MIAKVRYNGAESLAIVLSCAVDVVELCDIKQTLIEAINVFCNDENASFENISHLAKIAREIEFNQKEIEALNEIVETHKTIYFK